MRHATRVACAFALCLAWAGNAGANLIVNGDFSAGNTGFISDYTYSPTDIGPAQTYAIVNSPADARPHDHNGADVKDHTTGTGLLMAVNGSDTLDVLVWEEIPKVKPHHTYTFSLWIASWFPAAPEGLDLSINGTSIGTITAPSTEGPWQEFTTTWHSGKAKAADIQLRNITNVDVGNDFALDDISFDATPAATVPEPASLTLFGLATAGLGGFAWRRQKAQAT